MCNYGTVARPLIELLKNEEFQWTEAAEGAFRESNRRMTEAPALALLDFHKPFVVEANASGEGIGVVLTQ